MRALLTTAPAARCRLERGAQVAHVVVRVLRQACPCRTAGSSWRSPTIRSVPNGGHDRPQQEVLRRARWQRLRAGGRQAEMRDGAVAREIVDLQVGRELGRRGADLDLVVGDQGCRGRILSASQAAGRGAERAGIGADRVQRAAIIALEHAEMPIDAAVRRRLADTSLQRLLGLALHDHAVQRRRSRRRTGRRRPRRSRRCRSRSAMARRSASGVSRGGGLHRGLGVVLVSTGGGWRPAARRRRRPAASPRGWRWRDGGGGAAGGCRRLGGAAGGGLAAAGGIGVARRIGADGRRLGVAGCGGYGRRWGDRRHLRG